MRDEWVVACEKCGGAADEKRWVRVGESGHGKEIKRGRKVE